MALLKENGSLDVERINNLPLKEYVEEMGTLTNTQIDEYLSKLPINESNEPLQPKYVDSIEEWGVTLDDLFKE